MDVILEGSQGNVGRMAGGLVMADSDYPFVRSSAAARQEKGSRQKEGHSKEGPFIGLSVFFGFKKFFCFKSLMSEKVPPF